MSTIQPGSSTFAQHYVPAWQRTHDTLAWLFGWRFLERLLPARAVGYVAAATGISLVTALIGVTRSWLTLGNEAVLYLLAVLPAATRFGRGPAIMASLLAFLAFDWFFVTPLHTLTIAQAEEWLALLLYLVISLVTSHLAAAQRSRTEEAHRREREARALYELGRLLAGYDDLPASLQAVAEHLRGALSLTRCAVRLDPAPALDTVEAAEVVDAVPLLAGERRVGMLQLGRPAGNAGWSPEEARLIAAAAAQIGLAVERAQLRAVATAAEVLRRTDETRNTLVASVSHDLRTPLASIKASAGSLLQTDVQWDEAQRRGFAVAIDQEADHLSRLVENLLGVSRIEAGIIRPEREWYPFDAVVDDLLGRLRRLTATHRVVADVPDSLPPVPLDYVQIGQVLQNLLENAVQYTPPGSMIRISARCEGAELQVAVEDDGPGIPPDALPHVFEKFYRAAGGPAARRRGTGLGLAVARGLVEAHGGRIWACSPPPGAVRGTRAVFTLPLQPPGVPPPAPPPEVIVGTPS